ncbi:hypothetical protein FIU87_17830 [Bacillus sp. THAF10]|nr:hypothetical protein FIU87_17830 [Bacillus sp. THAF10]
MGAVSDIMCRSSIYICLTEAKLIPSFSLGELEEGVNDFENHSHRKNRKKVCQIATHLLK